MKRADTWLIMSRTTRAQLPSARLVATPMWLTCNEFRSPIVPPAGARPVAVAVPARDEADSIDACLAAIDAAAARVEGPVTVLLSANNCGDDTARRARRFCSRAATIVVDEIALSPVLAHAGGARRAAMDRAVALAGPGGVVMTTDADSRVDTDWIAANLSELAGADAVAGMIAFDHAARDKLPGLARRAPEWRLSTLHAQIEHLIDPLPHDPWPRHIWAWGASFALTVETYLAVGGVPLVPLAEDRALAAAVERADFRLRRSHAPLVFTSPRRSGRAPGGFADLLDSYVRDPATLCDAALEPTLDLVRRLKRRARLRASNAVDFGERWAAMESRSTRQRVHPRDLAVEVARAEWVIARLERREARRPDSPACAPAA